MRASRTRRTAHAVPLVGAACVALGGLACASRPPVRAHAVAMRTAGFAPAALVVAAGDTVTFTNPDLVPHTATAADGAFDSKQVDAGGAWRWVAGAPGRHDYVCAFHPGMRGTVEVR